ncbi:MAG: formimidoylglutamase [Bacillaceae bacterium]
MTLPYLKKVGEGIFVDSEVRKANELLQPWDEEQVVTYGLIGLPLSKTSISHSGAHLSPTTIRKMFSSYSTYSIEEEADINKRVVDFGDIQMHVTSDEQSRIRIYETVKALLHHHQQMVPILLGGDHGVSFPSIQAFQEERGKVGIVQFDAHHDLRNTKDGGRSNGTPFRSLLEEGIINGNQLVQIGLRDFSNSASYHQYAKEQGIHLYTMKDVKTKGILPILEQSIAILKQSCDVLYISVDMDVLDMAFAPGCPAIGPGGMDSTTLLEAIYYLGREEMVKGVDIVEIDPTVDFRDMTSKMAVHVILQFLLGRNNRLA